MLVWFLHDCMEQRFQGLSLIAVVSLTMQIASLWLRITIAWSSLSSKTNIREASLEESYLTGD